MADAGVDENHSVWGASISAAMARGVSLAEILRTADWSTEGVHLSGVSITDRPRALTMC